MKQSFLYSIGHGTKKINAFIKELEAFEISYLIDVRSIPYSKWHPQFNQEPFQMSLACVGINYVYMGDCLGGFPKDKTCYNSEGKVDYDLLKEKDFFKEGLKRLITANEKEIKVAIMCAESQPENCHRSKLIGTELLKYGISLTHI